MKYMKGLFDDWQAKGITSVLHEKKGGYANNTASMYGLAAKAEAEGVRILTGVEVQGFEFGSNSRRRHRASYTDQGRIACDQSSSASARGSTQIWDMLDLPKAITIKGRDGKMHDGVPMWTLLVPAGRHARRRSRACSKTNDGEMPPVIHVDTDAPLYSDVDGSLITDKLWGIYYKPDFNFGGVQGGAMPYKVEQDPDERRGRSLRPGVAGFHRRRRFRRICGARRWPICQKRFEGKIAQYKNEPSGGIGCFTPDNFPVFDIFRENVYFIADSNHGYKMIGVGKLVAQELMGEKSALLEPFRFSRFAEGQAASGLAQPVPVELRGHRRPALEGGDREFGDGSSVSRPPTKRGTGRGP